MKERQPVSDLFPQCMYCKHKHRQLSAAITAGNAELIKDINNSLSAHLIRSHVSTAETTPANP